MRVDFVRPNEPWLVTEVGDMIGLVFTGATPAAARVAVRPIPLGPSLEMVWSVPRDDWYAWALFDPAGETILFVGNPIEVRKGDEYAFKERSDSGH